MTDDDLTRMPPPMAAPDAPPPPTTPLTTGPAAEPTGDDRRRQWFPTIVAVLAFTAAAALLVLFLFARHDRDVAVEQRDRARTELADTQARLDDETARAEAAEQAAEEAGARADDAESGLASATADVERLEGERGDLETSIEEYRAATLDLLTIALASGVGLAAEEAECVALAFVTEQEGAALQQIVDANDDGSAVIGLGADLLRFGEECGVDPAVFDSPPPSPSPQADAYGDDPELDALYDACAGGDGGACDELYIRSAVGTEYERYGLTCGDRFTVDDAPETCAEAI